MSARRVVTTRRADQDIENVVDHYVTEGAHDAAHRFISTLNDLTILLGEYPSIGSSRFAFAAGVEGVRVVALSRFPHVAVYSDDADAVRIHRVLHTCRDIPIELTGSSD